MLKSFLNDFWTNPTKEWAQLVVVGFTFRNHCRSRRGWFKWDTLWDSKLCFMGIIEERLMKDLRSLCIQDTLIKDIIKQFTILAVEICQVLDNHTILIVTIVIKG
jgi:hypothetical protein